MAEWSIRECARNLHVIDFDMGRMDSELHVLLMSDLHVDSLYCDRELATRHLDEAKCLGAVVLDAGDYYDAMQSKHDRRANKAEMMKAFAGDQKAYLNHLVEMGTEFLLPYKDIIAVRGKGNHESAVERHNDYDLTQGLVDKLRYEGSKTVHMGGYSGYVTFRFHISNTQWQTKDLFYFHGAGGGQAQVTLGMIGTNRRGAFVDADVVWTGHIHEHWFAHKKRIRRTKAMVVEQIPQLHLCTPGYKDDYRDGYGGHQTEQGGAPKPRGAWWVRFFRVSGRVPRIGFDFRTAL